MGRSAPVADQMWRILLGGFMSRIALYREWRPQTFSDVVAQKQVVYPLKQSIINGEIGHAYLFSGTRGTGKTSVAKILAKAVNCLNPSEGNPCNQCEICQTINDGSLLDVMEIDAASNNSVDNIRRITDEIVFMPTRAKYKVYIIDEVHMLSTGAFNALLKTLEEPPEHAIFILATTEPYRITATVTSIFQRFDFSRIPQDAIIHKLIDIAEIDQIDIDELAILSIAQLSDGALRDAISLLDQASSGIEAPITREKLFDMVGIVQDQFMLVLTSALLQNDLQKILSLIDELVMSGRDLERFVTEFAQFLRNLLVTKLTGTTEDWFGLSDQDLEQIVRSANQISETILLNWIEEISKLSSELKFSGDIRIAIEVGLIKILNQYQATLGNTCSEEQTRIKQISQIEKTVTQSITNEAIQPEVQVEKISEPKPEVKPQVEPEPQTETVSAKQEQVKDQQSELPSDQHQQWQQVLDFLAKEHRIDLKMLLSPANVECNNNQWHITYQGNLQSHCKAVSEKENKQLIEKALQNSTGDQDVRLDICLAENQASPENNLNPDEPTWMKEVRQMAKDLNIPMKVED